MRKFLDTSVLVAAFDETHPHHLPSIELLRDLAKGEGHAAVHSLAEIYATVTAMPGPRRAHGREAQLYLHDLRSRLSWVALTDAEYMETLDACATMGLHGGIVYDALLARCALKAQAAAIYTWNTKHFLRLETEAARRVRTP